MGQERRKLDAVARRRLAEGTLTAPVEVLLRLAWPPGATEEAVLKAAGCEPLAISGTAVSATVARPEQLDAVARLPFVERIELARPLHQES
jgi:hypothetical protein